MIRLILATLFFALPAAAQWSPGAAMQHGPADWDQSFTLAFSATGWSSLPNQDVTACSNPTVELDGSDTKVSIYDCTTATAGTSECLEKQGLPSGGGNFGPTPTSFARGYVRARVLDAGAGGGTVTVSCENVRNRTFDGSTWVEDFGATGSGSILPGYNDSNQLGNDDTLEYLWALDSFQNVPAGLTTYYFSADASGDMPLGDDANDGLTPSTPKRSLGELDELLSTGCEQRFVLDHDSWDTLPADFDNPGDPAGEWDGGIGPPDAACVTDIERPAAYIEVSSGSQTQKAFVDCTVMTDEMMEGGNCPGFICGRELPGDSTGWIAVSNMTWDQCPGRLSLAGQPRFTDFQRGNLLALNVDGLGITNSARQFYSSHDGVGILINPGYTQKDVGTFDVECIGPQDPYRDCNGAGDARANSQFIANVSGGTVLISNREYLYENTKPAATSGNFMVGVGSPGVSDLIVLGARFRKAATVTNGFATAAVVGECRVINAQVETFLGYTQIANFSQSGDAGIAGEGISGNVSTLSCVQDQTYYQTQLEAIGYIGLWDEGRPANKDAESFEFTCSSVNAPAATYQMSFDSLSASGAGIMDFSAYDSHIDDTLTTNTFFLNNDVTTVQAFRTAVTGSAGASCGGNLTCDPADWFNARASTDTPIAGARGNTCRTARTVMFPTDDGTPATQSNFDGWLPAYVAHETVLGIRLGVDGS